MRLEYRRLDVFTDRSLGGNPLAVFLDAPDLPATQMQAIAREMNLSETVFVRSSAKPTEWPVRIFTPSLELPFAGHPTVGTAVALVQDGRCGARDRCELELLEVGGRVPVEVMRANERLASARFKVPRLPEFGKADLSTSTLSRLLGVDSGEILEGNWCPRAVSCGVPFYIVAVRSLAAIRRVTLRRDIWDQNLATQWAPHLYVITPEGERHEGAIHARMFAPAMGIDEDPATGGAVAALAGYLVDAEKPTEGRTRWRVEQGFEIGRPSIIDLEINITNGTLLDIHLSGTAVAMGGGHLLI